MLIELNCMDSLAVDVPMPSVYGEEISSLRIRQVLFQFPFKLLVGLCSRICRRHMWQDLTPVGVLMLSGIPLLSFGSIFSIYHWTHGFLTGVAVSAGTVMIGALSIILGFQLILQGLLLDVSWARRLSAVDFAALRIWIKGWQSVHRNAEADLASSYGRKNARRDTNKKVR